MKMDVVIPLAKGGSYWQDNELRYCLRSLEKHFLDLGKVFIVGHKPRWIKNISHIAIGDMYPDNKGASIINKLTNMCINRNVSDDFLFVSDDQYVLFPTRAKDIHTYYTYDMRGETLRKGNRMWMQCLRNARKSLLADGLPCYNYEPHTPLIINKDRYRETMLMYKWEEIQYPTLSLYFNNVLKHHEKLPNDYRAFFDQEGLDVESIHGHQFLCNTDLGLSFKLMRKLNELFPRKSSFEK
jgi:hypothetical protein